VTLDVAARIFGQYPIRRTEIFRPHTTNGLNHLRAVLDVAYHKGCHVPEFERFLHLQFDAARPYCGPVVKTSYPPQRMIRFHIDGIAYSKTIQFQVMPVAPDVPGRAFKVK